MMLLLLFSTIAIFTFLAQFCSFVGAREEIFEPMTRKDIYYGYDGKRYKWAMFDGDGIMTFKGEVNGRSNDLMLPNGNQESWQQQTCMANPTLTFEFCETDRKGPWIGLALCYESQLTRPKVNPFYRITHDPPMTRLVNAICGERQSALFINRTTNEAKPLINGTARYDPFYVIYTSFAPHKKMYFQMRDKRFEKQCALLILGGESLLRVQLTDLRRKAIPMFKKPGESNLEWKTETKVDKDNDFMHEFPDMANRKFSLSSRQGIEYLMLDFMPVYGSIQNISIYGWLPMKIKILSQNINPCKVDWKLLESREFRDREGTLDISYIVETETAQKKGDSLGGSLSQMLSSQGSLSVSGDLGFKSPFVSASAAGNYQNTAGSQAMSGSDFSISNQISQKETKERTESVQFSNYVGAINVEQMVYTCHGVDVYPDIIRYQDDEGRAMTPDEQAVDGKGDQAYDQPSPLTRPPTVSDCADLYAECSLWAQKGLCQTQPTHMKISCKESCQMCPNIDSNVTPSMDDGAPLAILCEDSDADCAELEQDGECEKNPLYMSKRCRRSCGLCDSVYDHDVAAEEAIEAKKDI